LYEYLEGILMRGVVRGGRELPREIAFYDIRKVGEWEDVADGATSVPTESVEGSDEGTEDGAEEAGIRKTKKFDFDVAEFAVDPGQDLLVLTEVRYVSKLTMRVY
jgi:hypothetical protein